MRESPVTQKENNTKRRDPTQNCTFYITLISHKIDIIVMYCMEFRPKNTPAPKPKDTNDDISKNTTQ